ncbi:MAG: hypothetical protein PHG61_04645, partial [Candidatus Marinimicrobia bacterium]|nr:hypothetical protein [Candidatus Neomarinimicrobiota bacterium]
MKLSRSLLLFGVFVFLNFSSLTADIIFVNSSATDGGDGTTWTTAFTSFQDGLDAAQSGDQIWVAKGSYYPSW